MSTGALIAPFAFLGPAYDDQLRYLYTSGVTDRLVRRKPLPVGLLGSGVYRSQPLRDLVDANITEDLLARIASEHIGGRRLLVVTMNVDAQRPVVWDLGRIAASANPSRRELLVDILVASASVPGAFAPVPIQVLANGRAITELHADAGPATQIFTVPEPLLAGGMSSQLPAGPRTMLYAIVNSVLMPEFEIVPDTTFQTAGRGLETLIKTQRRLTIEATQAFAERSRIRFRYASINEPVPGNSNEAFDLEYMRNLFRFGLERGRSGQLWDDTTTPGTPSAGASPR